MKCDQCDQEATVHELRVVAGKKVERHLCERCARKQGIATPPNGGPISPEMLMQAMQAAAKPAAAKPGAPAAPGGGALVKADVCHGCGLSYLEFRQSGLMGCPECYATFEAQLGPLLERAHEGGANHIGKSPKRAGGAAAGQPGPPPPPSPAALRAGQIFTLKKQLEEAVKAEQYEKAARLRDELRRLSEPAPGTAAGGSSGGEGATQPT